MYILIVDNLSSIKMSFIKRSI